MDVRKLLSRSARGVAAVGAGAVVLLAVSGLGAAVVDGDRQDAAAAAAVRALGDPEATTAVLPADFAAVMGYAPGVLGTGAAAGLGRPDGSCSSPLGGTRWRFTTACRQHDLGYDLLRYADRAGAPLGAWARRSIDDLFDERVHARCEVLGCSALATTYAVAVQVNSVRQSQGVPHVESSQDWARATAAGAAAGTLLLLPLPRRSTRVTPSARVRTVAA